MSLAKQIFSKQDWPVFYKELLINSISDEKIKSYCEFVLEDFERSYVSQRDGFYYYSIEDWRQSASFMTKYPEHPEVFRFLFFKFHTEGDISIDKLDLASIEIGQWLKDSVEWINESRDSGEYMLYEFEESRFMFEDILFHEETDEYIQQHPLTEEEQEAIENARIYADEQYNLLQQNFEDEGYRMKYIQAEKDYRETLNRAHERINYIDVEEVIIQPGIALLIKYALSSQITFNAEHIKDLISKINERIQSEWESNLNNIFKSHEFTPEELTRLINVSEQELTVDLIESTKGDFYIEVDRISEHLLSEFNQNFKWPQEESSFRHHLKCLITFLYHHYITHSCSSELLSLEKELGNRKWGTVVLKEVRDHEMMWLNMRNIDEAIFDTIYPPELEDDDKNWDILDEEWFTDGTESIFLDALNDISIDEEIALKSLKILDEFAKSSEGSIQSLDTKSFLDWLNADRMVEKQPDKNKETKSFISEALSSLDLPQSTLITLTETFTDGEFLRYSESVHYNFESEFTESFQDFLLQEDSDVIPSKIKDKYLKDLELIFKCLFFNHLHAGQIDTSHLFSIKADWVDAMEFYIDDRGPSNLYDMLITLPLLREKLAKTIDEQNDETVYEIGQKLQSFALKQNIQLEQQDLYEAVKRIQNSH